MTKPINDFFDFRKTLKFYLTTNKIIEKTSVHLFMNSLESDVKLELGDT